MGRLKHHLSHGINFQHQKLSGSDLENLISRADTIGDFNSDIIASHGFVNLLIVDLHRINDLGKISGMAEDLDRVPDMQLALGDLDRCHRRLCKKFDHFAIFFFRHDDLLPDDSDS